MGLPVEGEGYSCHLVLVIGSWVPASGFCFFPSESSLVCVGFPTHTKTDSGFYTRFYACFHPNRGVVLLSTLESGPWRNSGGDASPRFRHALAFCPVPCPPHGFENWFQELPFPLDFLFRSHLRRVPAPHCVWPSASKARPVLSPGAGTCTTQWRSALQQLLPSVFSRCSCVCQAGRACPEFLGSMLAQWHPLLLPPSVRLIRREEGLVGGGACQNSECSPAPPHSQIHRNALLASG